MTRGTHEWTPMSTPLRVLILEDRPADAKLMVHELRRAGYELDWKRVETEADYLANRRHFGRRRRAGI